MSLPRIGITLGDPGGIGPEIVIKSLSNLSALPEAQYVIFGHSSLIEKETKILGLKLDPAKVSIREAGAPVEIPRIGVADKENGLASFLYFREAVEAARTGKIRAIVTAPISKLSWKLGGIAFRSHTEYLEQLYPESLMTFWSAQMTVALFSHHLPLKEAVDKVTKENLLEFFRMLRESIEAAKAGHYEFLVAGLNPHAGEDGVLGREEQREIIPAVEEARAGGMNVHGPYPPDVVFRSAQGHPEKVVIALYHDQGLIAFKLNAFDTGVNVTLGMPFIRSSPDHGTAFDIAGKNLADPRSMVEAIRLAYELSPRSF
jgi:4-hydroxythreonine-4-phosphate dehydrogenase